MDLKESIDISNISLGILVGRFQVNELHEGHINLINTVCTRHKRVIVFLGIPVVGVNKENPLDFATRKTMIQELYPSIIVLPITDNKSDEKWSSELDRLIKLPYGDIPAVLYGSRDSFLPYYTGRHKKIELVSGHDISGTDIRKECSQEVIASSDFRSGIIYGTHAQRPVTYPTVDVVAYNDKLEILMAKKPNEDLYRFIGGFVDRTDECLEHAARREFMEETGGCEIDYLKYVTSAQINDWRYAKSDSGIMTSLFIGKFIFGNPVASDDIETIKWLNPLRLKETDIMPEHCHLFNKLMEYMNRNIFVKAEKFNIGDNINYSNGD